MFYTKPVKGGTISNGAKPESYVKPANSVKPAAVKPAANVKSKSLEQIRNEMEAQQDAITDLDRQQYTNMLKGGGDHDRLEALKAQREAALKELREAYSNAMGLNEKKPKNQLLATHGSRMDDAYRQAIQQRTGNGSTGKQASGANDIRDMQQSNEQLFWEGFRKGLGLKEGEEVGQETHVAGGRRGDIGAAQESEQGGQFSSFVYGYSEDNPLLDAPTVDDNVYITEEEYNDLKQELDDILEGRNGETGAQASYQDIYMQLMKLEENRKWSICTDMAVETEPGSAQGLRVDIDSEEYTELKTMLGGSHKAAGCLADYILDEYGDKFVDSRARDSIIAEIYIHDYLNSLIPDDLDYSSITNSNMAEALTAWKLTAQELNLVYDGDANNLFAGIISIATGIALFDFMDEGVLQQATYLFMLNDYRDRYGIGALVDFFQPY